MATQRQALFRGNRPFPLTPPSPSWGQRVVRRRTIRGSAGPLSIAMAWRVFAAAWSRRSATAIHQKQRQQTTASRKCGKKGRDPLVRSSLAIPFCAWQPVFRRRALCSRASSILTRSLFSSSPFSAASFFFLLPPFSSRSPGDSQSRFVRAPREVPPTLPRARIRVHALAGLLRAL